MYFFGVTFNDEPTPQLYYKIIMEFVVSEILPIIYPDEINKDNSHVIFQSVQFTADKLKSIYDPKNYKGWEGFESGLTYKQAQKYLHSQANPSSQS